MVAENEKEEAEDDVGHADVDSSSPFGIKPCFKILQFPARQQSPFCGLPAFPWEMSALHQRSEIGSCPEAGTFGSLFAVRLL